MTLDRRSHPSFDERGSCVRCGLSSNVPRCPPGFWMTAWEAVKWSFASESERKELEERL